MLDNPAPDGITLDAFQRLLERYPAVLQAVSDAKGRGVRPGQQTLAELDDFRYREAPARFGPGGAEQMGLEHVQTLVAWKLRHGKFRPTLLKLVSSNEDAVVRETVREALNEAQNESTEKRTMAALRVLCRLRGIGPATASLLLAVHDPQHAIFFADAAYAWLCGGAALAMPSKYNEREYEHLCRQAAALQQRLGTVRAADIEKVAYVVVEEAKKPEARPKAPKPAQPKQQKQQTQPEKRKLDEEPPRRSLRLRKS